MSKTGFGHAPKGCPENCFGRARRDPLKMLKTLPKIVSLGAGPSFDDVFVIFQQFWTQNRGRPSAAAPLRVSIVCPKAMNNLKITDKWSGF